MKKKPKAHVDLSGWAQSHQRKEGKEKETTQTTRWEVLTNRRSTGNHTCRIVITRKRRAVEKTTSNARASSFVSSVSAEKRYPKPTSTLLVSFEICQFNKEVRNVNKRLSKNRKGGTEQEKGNIVARKHTCQSDDIKGGAPEPRKHVDAGNRLMARAGILFRGTGGGSGG
jgi:hypothetical protein